MAELVLSGEQFAMSALLGGGGAFITGLVVPDPLWVIVVGAAGLAAGVFLGPMIIEEGSKLAARMG